MTAPATTRRAGPFTGNGVATSFPFTYKVFAATDLAVVKTSAAGVETPLALGVDYNVTLNADQDASPGGSITYPISGVALLDTERLTATGALPYDQTADLPTGGNYRAQVIENALDRTVMQVQQVAEEVGRALTLPVSAAGADTTLPVPEGGKVIAWNVDGTGLVNLDSGDLASVVVAGTSYTDIFSGTGSQTAFTLTADPGSVNALDIAISGVSQVNGVDFNVSGTTLAFVAAPPAGTGNVVVRYVAALPNDGALGALAGTASGRGTWLIGWLRAAAGAVATTLYKWMSWRHLNLFEFLTPAQIADVQAYTYGVDVSVPVQAAITAAWTSGKKLIVPPGGYKVNSLALYETGPEAARVLWMEGTGVGNPFTAGSAAGTIFQGSIDDPVFSVYTSAVSTSTGTLKIKGITFIGTTTTAVVFLESLYGTSEIVDCVFRQEGIGNGMQVQVMATCSIHDCYFLNRDLVAIGLGAARVGVGLWIDQQYDAGLQTVYKCTSRGFLTAYRIGATSGTGRTYNASLYDSECSLTYHGVHITGRSKATRVENIYCEGGEGGYAFWDEADFTTIRHCYTFPGYSVHIKSTDFTYGNVYDSNALIVGTDPNQVLIDVTSSGSPSGPGKTVSNNHMSFQGSGGVVAGVVGLRINGADPRISMHGNNFSPRGAWTGGAGTYKIRDLSASSDGTSGSGVYGMRVVQSRNGAQEAPAVGRGAVNLAVDPTTITTLTAGAMNLGQLSVHTADLGAVNLTSFTSENLPDKTFSVHFVAAAARPTLKQGALLKLLGSVDYAITANGSWHTFQVKPGGVVWETARVVY